jgi:hypothetical protein
MAQTVAARLPDVRRVVIQLEVVRNAADWLPNMDLEVAAINSQFTLWVALLLTDVAESTRLVQQRSRVAR